MSSKIFIISEFVDKHRNSTGYYWAKIIEGLSSEFVGLRVICPKDNLDYLDKSSVKYISTPSVKFFNKRKMIARFFYELTQSVLLAFKVIRNVKKNDLIFSGTNPIFLLVFLFFLKKLIGFKWILLVHDVFPDNLISSATQKKDSIFYKWLKSFFDYLYSCPNIIIAIGMDMKELLLSKTKNKNIVEYVPNWVDLSDVPIIEKEKALSLKGIKLSGKVIFQFFGNIGRFQAIDDLLKSIVHCENDNAVFLFIGKGSETYLVERYQKKYPHKNIILLDALPFGENYLGLSCCDVAIVSLAAGMRGLAVPSKAYFSLAADKPILIMSDDGSELANLVSKNPELGWFCGVGDVVRFSDLVDQICAQAPGFSKKSPRLYLEENLSYNLAMTKYISLIKSIS